MTEWFSQLSAFGIFLAIAAVGFLFLLVSLIFGEIFEGLSGDHDFDHGADAGMEHGGPGFFSTRVMSVFVTAFGGFGAVASNYGMSTVGASAVGFGSGVFFASMIYAFARFLYGQQASTDIRSSDLEGQTARVVVAIPKDGMGQVRCQVGEAILDKVARSHDGAPIAENTIIRIEKILGETVVVKRE